MDHRLGIVLTLASSVTLGCASAEPGSPEDTAMTMPSLEDSEGEGGSGEGPGDGGDTGGSDTDGGDAESGTETNGGTDSADEDGPLMLLEATIPASETDHLELRFNRAVAPTDGAGLRLVGGAASISGPSTVVDARVLSIPLSDHVLPDDAFTVTFWPELGAIEAATDSEHDDRLAPLEGFPVDNEASGYEGDGQLYFVAADGDDGSSGMRDDPLRSLEVAAELAEPGDYVLLQRGDTFALSSGQGGSFRGHFEPPRSGQPGRVITYGAYGSGERPRVEAPSGSGAAIAIRDADYVHLDNLEVIADDGDYGVLFVGRSTEPTVTNCRVRARNDNGGYGGIYFGASVGGEHVSHPVVRFNDVLGFRTNYSSNGYDMGDRHEVLDGGLLEGNLSGDVTQDNGHDGFKAARGDFHGLVIRKNEVTGWLDDGLETFGAQNVVVEYNVLHSPQPPIISEGSGKHASQGIKAGGTDNANGYHAANITVRYNAVYDLPYDSSSNGIIVNSGRSGEIYGNVVHDVRRIGIKIDCNPCEEKGWRVHHNTVVAAGTEAIQVYTGGSNGHRVWLFNNILDGATDDLRVSTGGGQSTVGGGNLLVNGTASGAYEGDDLEASLDSLFVDLEPRDLRLRADAPAVDAGLTVEGYGFDRAGVPVPTDAADVGAYEHHADQ